MEANVREEGEEILNSAKLPSSSQILQCKDQWGWDVNQKSSEVTIFGRKGQTALFHSTWSSGSAAVRGERILNSFPPSRFYWEIKVGDRIFGTSMMFGVGTRKSILHMESFVNLIGCDVNAWGLSHKGLLWHNDEWKSFTKPFPENQATTLGLLFDGVAGTLSYFRDGVDLGVAFTGLNLIKDKLYPMVSSTAAKTEMTLQNMQRDFFNLQDRCRQRIIECIEVNHSLNDLHSLELPRCLENMIRRNDLKDADETDDGFDEVQPLIHEESDILRRIKESSLSSYQILPETLRWQHSFRGKGYPVCDF